MTTGFMIRTTGFQVAAWLLLSVSILVADQTVSTVAYDDAQIDTALGVLPQKVETAGYTNVQALQEKSAQEAASYKINQEALDEASFLMQWGDLNAASGIHGMLGDTDLIQESVTTGSANSIGGTSNGTDSLTIPGGGGGPGSHTGNNNSGSF